MKKIQMVDLKSQYEKIRNEVNAGIQEVIDTTTFIKGGKVNEFQTELEKYLGVKHVIPVGNGTDALQIAMMGLGLKPGDEVITADFTFAATVEVIALLQLTPVLVDVDMHNMNISIEGIKRAITPKTKAIVPVHLFGRAANMEAIMALAKEHNLYVIEDNAQAIGANCKFSDGTKKKAGTIGHVGATSFFPSKNLGCYGDGGAMYTNNSELAERLKMIANHGQKQKYFHEIVGCNSRLDAMQAAVLNVKLPRLDTYIAARRKVADHYDKLFANYREMKTPVRVKESKHVFHQYTLTVNGINRDALNAFLAEHDVPSMIYYPVPAHKQKMFASFGSDATLLPKTDWLTERVISLPIHTEMEQEQLDFICSTVAKFLTKN